LHLNPRSRRASAVGQRGSFANESLKAAPLSGPPGAFAGWLQASHPKHHGEAFNGVLKDRGDRGPQKPRKYDEKSEQHTPRVVSNAEGCFLGPPVLRAAGGVSADYAPIRTGSALIPRRKFE